MGIKKRDVRLPDDIGCCYRYDQFVLNKTNLPAHTEYYDLTPPHSRKINQQFSREQKTENERRIGREDSMRRVYMSSFMNHDWSAFLALKTGLNRDTVISVIDKTYGNWAEIGSYFEKNAREYKSTVLALLMQLSDKDLVMQGNQLLPVIYGPLIFPLGWIAMCLKNTCFHPGSQMKILPTGGVFSGKRWKT